LNVYQFIIGTPAMAQLPFKTIQPNPKWQYVIPYYFYGHLERSRGTSQCWLGIDFVSHCATWRRFLDSFHSFEM